MNLAEKVAVAGVAAFVSAHVFADASAAPFTVKSEANLRIWQTVTNPSSPLAWPWENGADTAAVCMTDRATGRTVSATVEKSGDELYGSYMPPLPEDGAEVLYAAELVLTAGGAEVARYSAELAYVNGVAGRAFDVQPADAKEWGQVPRPRIATYDASWLDSTADAQISTLTSNGGAAETLEGTSGYLVLKSEAPGDMRLDLGFDGDPVVWTAFLRFGVPGMMLIFR